MPSGLKEKRPPQPPSFEYLVPGWWCYLGDVVLLEEVCH